MAARFNSQYAPLALICVAIAATTSSCKRASENGSTVQKGWDSENNPDNVRLPGVPNLVRKFSASPQAGELPLEGTMPEDKLPWADSYFPSYLGGIANRWNTPVQKDAKGCESLYQSVKYNPVNIQQIDTVAKTPQELITINYKNEGRMFTGAQLANMKAKVAAKQMSEQDMLAALAELSPAEKYDVFMGHTDSYPLVNWERWRVGWEQVAYLQNLKAQGVTAAAWPTQIPTWMGMCMGWAFASINYKEPKSIILENTALPADKQIKVPFGASDIKALLMFYQRTYSFYKGILPGDIYKRVGQRCNDATKKSAACLDTNAGSFHIVLANLIGLQKKGLVADLDNGPEVWNFPIFAYSSKVKKTGFGKTYTPELMAVGMRAEPGTAEIYEVETQLKVKEETVQSWNDLSTHAPKNWAVREYKDDGRAANPSKPYKYYIEVNSNGNIIGGEWMPKSDYPDLLWDRPAAPFKAGDYLSKLQEIYDKSITSGGTGPNFQKFPDPWAQNTTQSIPEACRNNLPR